MPKRLTIDYIREVVEGEGYKLVSDSYKNKNSYIEYICDRGHRCRTTWVNFNARRTCFHCFGSKKKTIEEIRKELSKEGYKLVSDKYINNKTKLKAICPSGHEWWFRWNDFVVGYRCGECYGNKKHSIEYIKEKFNERGYILLSDKYTGEHCKLKYRCPKGHKGIIEWNNFRSGHGCLECAGSLKYTIRQVDKEMGKYGYTLITKEYKNNKDKLKYVCPNGHYGFISFSSFMAGIRCRKCFLLSNKSKAEKDLLSFVRNNIKEEVISGDLEVLEGKELDIFIPSKKLAIEYCGLYWHSEISGRKERRYHRDKYDLCREKGIRLITVFEDEYINSLEVVRSRILNALGVIDKTVYARDCSFVEVDKVEAQRFLGRYHLQGYSGCNYRYGLKHKNNLIGVVTFGKSSRSNASKKNMLEMKRLAFKSGISVVGGASKLFKNSIKELKCVYTHLSIKSYCDLRWASSHKTIYDVLGFNLLSETKYTPHYVMGGKRYRNQTFALKPEEKSLNKTEWELRKSQGYDRIWDCGHRTYLYEV